RVAAKQDHFLRPLPKKANLKTSAIMKDLKKKHPFLRQRSKKEASRYVIVESAVKDTCFFSFAYDGETLVLVLNPEHPFYREIYKPLAAGEDPRDQQLRTKLELMLLAAARSEVAKKKHEASRQRVEWSNTLAVYLNN